MTYGIALQFKGDTTEVIKVTQIQTTARRKKKEALNELCKNSSSVAIAIPLLSELNSCQEIAPCSRLQKDSACIPMYSL